MTPPLNIWSPYLFIVIFTYITYLHTREYQIKNSNVPIYLYKVFDDIKDDIFPRYININLSISKLAGTLLYSIDRKKNQLIVTLHEGIPSFIQVELNGQHVSFSLKELCGCDYCRYKPLELNILLNSHIKIICNNRNWYSFEISKDKQINEDYPIFSTDQNHLWFVNTPGIGNTHSNGEQMYGCIFKVLYKNVEINFTNMTSDISNICPRQCSDTFCNGGECLETYNDSPLCNCTATMANGRYCNETIKPMNLRSSNQLFQFDYIKLSWKSVNNIKVTINNTDFEVSLENEISTLSFKVRNIKKRFLVTKELSGGYIPGVESILVVNFTKNNIDIRLFHNSRWSYELIQGEYDISGQLFQDLLFRSVAGNMSLATKSFHEYTWSTVNILHPIEIKNDIYDNSHTIANVTNASIVTDRTYIIAIVTKSSIVTDIKNNQNTIIAITIPSVLILLCIIVVFVVVMLSMRRIRISQYQRIPVIDNETDENEMTIFSEHQLVNTLMKDYKDYVKECKKKIGIEIFQKHGNNLREWIDFIKPNVKADTSRMDQMKRLYELGTSINDDYQYLRAVILLFIHIKLFLNIDNNEYETRSVQYLTALLCDKHDHETELEVMTPCLIKCMLDFLEDLSKYDKQNALLCKLLDEMLAFVGYTITNDGYSFKTKRDVSFLENYSSMPNLKKLWSSIIMFTFLGNKKYITKTKEYLNDTVKNGERLSRDVIRISLVIVKNRNKDEDKPLLTNVDIQLIIAMREYKISEKTIKLFTNDVIRIFDKYYKEEILQNIEWKLSLSEKEEISIQCLTKYLEIGSVDRDKTISILLPLLEVFKPHVPHNTDATKICTAILGHMYKNQYYQKHSEHYNLRQICIEYFKLFTNRDDIRLISSMIICHTSDTIDNAEGLDDVVSYLCNVINDMSNRGSEEWLGITVEELNKALSLIRSKKYNSANQLPNMTSSV